MTLHIALDGIYNNVNVNLIKTLQGFLTRKSYNVRVVFPLQDETILSILVNYDLTFSEKALLQALDRSITWNNSNFRDYDIVLWDTSIISSYVYHTNDTVKTSFIKTVNKFFPNMDAIFVIQPSIENNVVLDKFSEFVDEFDNVYQISYTEDVFEQLVVMIFEVLPTCSWCGRIYTKCSSNKKYCCEDCRCFAKEEQNRINFRKYYHRYKDTMSETRKGALGSRGANLHSHANSNHEVEARLISREKKRLGL